jgi:hypothetical protein
MRNEAKGKRAESHPFEQKRCPSPPRLPFKKRKEVCGVVSKEWIRWNRLAHQAKNALPVSDKNTYGTALC